MIHLRAGLLLLLLREMIDKSVSLRKFTRHCKKRTLNVKSESARLLSLQAARAVVDLRKQKKTQTTNLEANHVLLFRSALRLVFPGDTGFSSFPIIPTGHNKKRTPRAGVWWKRKDFLREIRWLSKKVLRCCGSVVREEPPASSFARCCSMPNGVKGEDFLFAPLCVEWLKILRNSSWWYNYITKL